MLVEVVKNIGMKQKWWMGETYDTMELALYIREFLG